MANTDVIVDNEAYIQDVYSDNTITGGSKIYLRSYSVKYPFKNLISHEPKVLIEPDFTSGDTGSSVGSNWERRKSYNSYQGMEKLMITVSGYIYLDNSGSLSSGYQLATVGRLWKLWNSPVHMPFYFYDSKIGSALANTSYDPTLGNPFVVGSIPVAILDVTFDWSNRSLNRVPYTMTLKEEKIL